MSKKHFSYGIDYSGNSGADAWANDLKKKRIARWESEDKTNNLTSNSGQQDTGRLSAMSRAIHNAFSRITQENQSPKPQVNQFDRPSPLKPIQPRSMNDLKSFDPSATDPRNILNNLKTQQDSQNKKIQESTTKAKVNMSEKPKKDKGPNKFVSGTKKVANFLTESVQNVGEDISAPIGANILLKQQRKSEETQKKISDNLISKIKSESDPIKKQKYKDILNNYAENNRKISIDVLKEVPALNKSKAQVIGDFAGVGLDIISAGEGSSLTKDGVELVAKKGAKELAKELAKKGFKVAAKEAIKKNAGRMAFDSSIGAGYGLAGVAKEDKVSSPSEYAKAAGIGSGVGLTASMALPLLGTGVGKVLEKNSKNAGAKIAGKATESEFNAGKNRVINYLDNLKNDSNAKEVEVLKKNINNSKTKEEIEGHLNDFDKNPLAGKEIGPVIKIHPEVLNSESGANAWTELQNATAGKRIPLPDGGMVNQSSTFPDWVPDGLRNKKTVSEVAEHMSQDTLPKPGTKANELYEVVREKLNKETGFSVSKPGVTKADNNLTDFATEYKPTVVDNTPIKSVPNTSKPTPLSRLSDKITSTKYGNYTADVLNKVKKSLVSDISPVTKDFSNQIDNEAGMSVNRKVRELIGNVRQSAGEADALLKSNKGYQELSNVLDRRKLGLNNKDALTNYKDIGDFINRKQDAINKNKLGKNVKIPTGTAQQEAAYKSLNKATKDVIERLHKAGIIDDYKYADWMAGSDYTRVQREVGEQLNFTGPAKGEGSLGSTVASQKLKGSELQARDPFATFTEWNRKVAKEVNTNKLANYVIEQRQKLGLDAAGGFRAMTKDAADRLRLTGALPEDAISRFEKGVKQLYQTDPAVAKSLNGMDKLDLGVVGRWALVPSRILQSGATSLNLSFPIKNYLRDQASSFVFSNDVLATHNPLSIFEGIKESTLKPIGKGITRNVGLRDLGEKIFKPSPPFELWLKHNANVNEVDLARQIKSSAQESLSDFNIKAPGIKNFADRQVRKLEDIGSATEKSTRFQNFIGVYRKALKAGDSSEIALSKANIAARENVVDFSQKGDYAPFMRIFNPYLNAGIQGSRQLARSLAERPTATMLKIGATVMLPVAYATYHNLSDPKRAMTYAAIPSYVKQNNLVYVLPNNKGYVTVPLPQGFGQYSQPLRNVIEGEYVGDKQAFIGTAKSIFDSFNPTSGIGDTIPQAIRPAIENITNHSFYKNAPVVPDYLSSKAPKDQSYASTSQSYKDIGGLLNISPLKVQNLVSGYGASGAQQVVSILDKARKVSGEKNVSTDDHDTISQIVKGLYSTQPDLKKAATSSFYDTYSPLSTKRAAVSKQIKSLRANNKPNQAKRVEDEWNNSLKGKFSSVNNKFGWNDDWSDRANKLYITTKPAKY